jgi:hypothetical protein
MIQSGVADPGPGYTAWEAAVQAPVANMVINHLIATNLVTNSHVFVFTHTLQPSSATKKGCNVCVNTNTCECANKKTINGAWSTT